jgi:hypothetical protein
MNPLMIEKIPRRAFPLRQNEWKKRHAIDPEGGNGKEKAFEAHGGVGVAGLCDDLLFDRRPLTADGRSFDFF